MDIGIVFLMFFALVWFLIFLNAFKKRNSVSNETTIHKTKINHYTNDIVDMKIKGIID